MSDTNTPRHRALTGEGRRALERRYNGTVLAAMCRDAVTGEPCTGQPQFDGADRPACEGILAYVRYALRQRPTGDVLALAFGRCDLCKAVGTVEVDLPR